MSIEQLEEIREKYIPYYGGDVEIDNFMLGTINLLKDYSDKLARLEKRIAELEPDLENIKIGGTD